MVLKSPDVVEVGVSTETKTDAIELRDADGGFIQIQLPDKTDARGNTLYEVNRFDHGSRKPVSGNLVDVRIAEALPSGTVFQVKDERGEFFYRVGEPMSQDYKKKFPKAVFAERISGDEMRRVKDEGEYIASGSLPYSLRTTADLGNEKR